MNQTPPIIPPLKDIDRAILLLGNRCKSELRSKKREELEQLIGEYPKKIEIAAAWKSFLKRYKKDPENAEQEKSQEQRRIEQLKKAFRPKHP